MSRDDRLAPLKECDAQVVSMRRDLRMDPRAYVDLVFAHREEGLVVEARCVCCEGQLEIMSDGWWQCSECSYEFGPEEMRWLRDQYSEALNRIFPEPERKKERWVWVRWLVRLLGITRLAEWSKRTSSESG